MEKKIEDCISICTRRIENKSSTADYDLKESQAILNLVNALAKLNEMKTWKRTT